MRNYVIINGTTSLNKSGLAIKELPPITKPAMRTNTETIDGRDGDLITELGYNAYDKEIEIGLFGNHYSIDDIITYFNQSGTIIFSNETDKYYNFKILDQINYEKLIKFKTATVTFHCQPFKYEVGETPVTLATGNNTVKNKGNIYSKPILYIKGSGTVSVSLNGNQIFLIDMGNTTSEITIDIENLEAYDPTDNSLSNRKVTGDYDEFKLNSGNNTINLSGTITTANISKYSRWL